LTIDCTREGFHSNGKNKQCGILADTYVFSNSCLLLQNQRRVRRKIASQHGRLINQNTRSPRPPPKKNSPGTNQKPDTPCKKTRPAGPIKKHYIVHGWSVCYGQGAGEGRGLRSDSTNTHSEQSVHKANIPPRLHTCASVPPPMQSDGFTKPRLIVTTPNAPRADRPPHSHAASHHARGGSLFTPLTRTCRGGVCDPNDIHNNARTHTLPVTSNMGILCVCVKQARRYRGVRPLFCRLFFA